MPINNNDGDLNLSLPDSLKNGEHDTLTQKQYINDLGSLSNINAIPAVVTGVARHVVLESSHRNILSLLPLVTNNFWQAVHTYFEPFIWKVHHPNDVSCESDNFDDQVNLVTKLIFELESTGAHIAGNTDTTRYKNAQAVIRQMSKLRKLLDDHSGLDKDDEYTGLLTPSPWEILENNAIQFSHKLVPQPEGTPYRKFIGLNSHDHEIVSRLSLQDLLKATERRFFLGAEKELSNHREKQSRHRRFASKLSDWFKDVRVQSGEDFAEPTQAITETSAATLKALYPDQPNIILKRPLG